MPLDELDSLQNQYRPSLLDSLPPSISLLPHQYSVTLDHHVASTDLCYALSELLMFAASSEAQFLNLIERRISALIDGFQGQETLVLDELHYTSRLLQDHIQHTSGILSFLKGCSVSKPQVTRWHPWLFSEEQQQPRASKALQTEAMLIEDFLRLRERTNSLIVQARDGMSFVSNGVIIQESRRAISSADRVERLTLLAFFFLPLSLTTSFFGSNFTELGTGRLSIWVMFIVLLPVMLFSTVICFWGRFSSIQWLKAVPWVTGEHQ